MLEELILSFIVDKKKIVIKRKHSTTTFTKILLVMVMLLILVARCTLKDKETDRTSEAHKNATIITGERHTTHIYNNYTINYNININSEGDK